jgi:hypothetical protein
MVVHAGRRLVGAAGHDGLTLVRRRLVLAQSAYALAVLLVLVSPVASIVALAAFQLFFVISPRLPVRV